MTDYLRLRLRMTLRSIAATIPGRMLAFLAAGMILAAGIQFVLLGQATEDPTGPGAFSDRLQAEVGYAVLLLAALSLVTGSQSSRFPCTPADVAWVYASPLPMGHIILAQLVWQAARRCILWISGGVIADVVATVAVDSDPGLFISRAVLATPLLVALVILSIGAGSTRGSRAPARATMWLGAAFAVAVLVPLPLEIVGGATPGEAVDGAALSSLARSVGAVLFGDYDPLSVGVLVTMTALGAALCRAGGAGLREQLTLDAAFWAEFNMTSMRATVEAPKPSFRRLSRLTGPWSILWFEVAVLRRANYQRWSFPVLLATSVLTGGFAHELVPLFAFAAPLSVVTGAYLSGVARHLRLRTLLLVPGRMACRVAAGEAVPALLASIGVGLSVAVGGLVGGYGVGEVATFLLRGLAVLVVALAIRVAAAALTYRDGVLAGGLYHLTLTVMTVAGTSVVVAMVWLGAKLATSTPVALAVLWGVASLLFAAALRLFQVRVGPVPGGGRGQQYFFSVE